MPYIMTPPGVSAPDWGERGKPAPSQMMIGWTGLRPTGCFQEMLPTSGTPVFTRRKSPQGSKPLAFVLERRLFGVNSTLLLVVEIFHGRTSRAGMRYAKAKPRTGAGIASSPRYGKWRI